MTIRAGLVILGSVPLGEVLGILVACAIRATTPPGWHQLDLSDAYKLWALCSLGIGIFGLAFLPGDGDAKLSSTTDGANTPGSHNDI